MYPESTFGAMAFRLKSQYLDVRADSWVLPWRVICASYQRGTTPMDSRPPLPSVQTAYRIVRKGDPVTALVRDDNTPVPTSIPRGQVLIRVQAVSLNPMCVFISISHMILRIDLKRMSFSVDAQSYSAATN